jgi:chaperone LolA
VKVTQTLKLCSAICLSAIFLSTVTQAAALPKFKAFSQSTSGRADFEQTVLDRAGKVVQKANGKFAYARPGKFRWDYDKPAQVIVGDGVKVWIFDRDLNQVTVRKIDSAVSSTPAALLTGSTRIETLFNFTELGVNHGIEWLEAKPKNADTNFESIRIGFAGDNLAEMELFDQFGSRTLLKFSGFRRDAGVEPGMFKFTPPKGADVISDN